MGWRNVIRDKFPINDAEIYPFIEHYDPEWRARFPSYDYALEWYLQTNFWDVYNTYNEWAGEEDAIPNDDDV